MQNIYKSIVQQKDNVIKREFENLKFSKDFSVEFPDTDSVETFEMTGKPSLSGEEVYKRFDDTVEKYFPGFLTEDEKRNYISSILIREMLINLWWENFLIIKTKS